MSRLMANLTGKIFGDWTVNSYAHKINQRNYWECTCSCGNSKLVDGGELSAGRTKSCGHGKKVDLCGMTFGEWYVESSSRIVPEEDFKHYWLCKCSCGNVREVPHGNLMSGTSTNCGHMNDVFPIILSGNIFHEWTVISENPTRKGKSKYYFCQCSCGNTKYVEYKSLHNGTSTNCGHRHNDGIVAGMRFGRLTVLGFSRRGETGNCFYNCSCSCGNFKEKKGSDLKFGNVSSCGCYRRESSSIRAIENQKKISNRNNHSWYFYDKDHNKINCKSSFEVLYWNYHNFVKNENIQYEPVVIKLANNRRYVPDFYFVDTDCWIETKGSFSMSKNGEVQKEKINFLKSKMNISVLFWKDIVVDCQLQYKSVTSYFNNAVRQEMKIEDYLAEMKYMQETNEYFAETI